MSSPSETITHKRHGKAKVAASRQSAREVLQSQQHDEELNVSMLQRSSGKEDYVSHHSCENARRKDEGIEDTQQNNERGPNKVQATASNITMLRKIERVKLLKGGEGLVRSRVGKGFRILRL
eukprot:scaffold1435_cov162-Ochromonas_danica.AAC.4